MNKQSIRSFGIGIFFIGALIYTLNILNIPLPGMEPADEAAQKEISTLQKQLAAANEQLAQNDTADEDKQPAVEPVAEPVKEAADNVSEEPTAAPQSDYTLTIYRGITSYDISRKLEDAGIVDNALQFELFLVNDGYSKRLQVGDYTITPAMSDEEIAVLITTP